MEAGDVLPYTASPSWRNRTSFQINPGDTSRPTSSCFSCRLCCARKVVVQTTKPTRLKNKINPEAAILKQPHQKFHELTLVPYISLSSLEHTPVSFEIASCCTTSGAGLGKKHFHLGTSVVRRPAVEPELAKSSMKPRLVMEIWYA